MCKLLVFAGTTEGRILLSSLADADHEDGLGIVACVATDYGKELLEKSVPHIKVLAGRLDEAEIIALIEEEGFDCVIDGTHPYARVVTENIKSACNRTDCSYIRVIRASGEEVSEGLPGELAEEIPADRCLFFEDHEEVVSFLSRHDGKILMTIGSKSLADYTKLEGYRERLFIRVLPMAEVLENCANLGFSGNQILAMQGPFSFELNRALMVQIGAEYLVTKDTGDSGGFGEKLRAALDLGITPLILGRKEEEGFSIEETFSHLKEIYGLSFKERRDTDTMREEYGEGGQESSLEKIDLGRWFPFFIDIADKHIVVVGGGKIAGRRILTLCRFLCKVTVVAKEASSEIVELASTGRIELKEKPYEPTDLSEADIVLAATNDPTINEDIHIGCKARGIPVNVASNKEKSDFYFPGIVRKNDLTIGITAEGKNHRLAKDATRTISNLDFLKGEESGEKKDSDRKP